MSEGGGDTFNFFNKDIFKLKANGLARLSKVNLPPIQRAKVGVMLLIF
jgi:hypothetical protein